MAVKSTQSKAKKTSTKAKKTKKVEAPAGAAPATNGSPAWLETPKFKN